ncbi:MAG: EamA family transporter [Cohaesibacteraceae bacterium]|nr:EamA family transporter [Cohaesibacteraceae bacterium]MBL4876492.1 EamA family transporter [Cohaesibacteraceae bacterium]
MSGFVITIVLFAALFHATWNALVKGAQDRTITIGLVALGHVIPGVILVYMFAAPSFESIKFIIASTIIHWLYYYLLNIAYRYGDLSVVYPISRGLTPIIIALGAQYWIGEVLPTAAWLGIITISIGVIIVSWDSISKKMPYMGLLAAAGLAIVISAYSTVDGVGVRISNNSMAYIGWLFIAEIFVVIFVFSSRWSRLAKLPVKQSMLGILGGVMSGTAYGMVLYAQTLAPLGIVSAVRETSVIFAAIIGVYFFREGKWPVRLLAASAVGLGIILIAFGTQVDTLHG